MIMLVFNVISIFLLSFNYKSTILKKIICTSLIYSFLLINEIIISSLIGFLDISIYKNSSFNSIIGIILIRMITVIIAYLLSKYKKSNKIDNPLPKIYYAAFTIILFGTLYLFVSSLDNNNLTIQKVIISGIVLIIVNITMIFIDEKIYNSIIQTNEKNLLKQQNLAYENQAQIIFQTTESIKSIRHDMKNHLFTINEMCKKNKNHEIQLYLDKILDQINNGDFSDSNNFVIDSIINLKLGKLKGTDTKIIVNVNIPQTINILAYDITVILGNLLDNAITAVMKSDNKEINLQITYNMGNLIILLDNSYNGKIIYENGKFKTTKIFNGNHGIGLANIEKSLEKYNGEIRTEYTSNIFSVSVLIPC